MRQLLTKIFAILFYFVDTFIWTCSFFTTKIKCSFCKPSLCWFNDWIICDAEVFNLMKTKKPMKINSSAFLFDF
jgi:hypothetical protein